MKQNRTHQRKFTSLLLLGGLVLGIFGPAGGEVSRLEVDTIRGKSVLSPADKTTLATFVTEQFAKMLVEKELANLGDISYYLASCSNLTIRNDTAQQAYSDYFATLIRDGYKKTLTTGAGLADKAAAEQVQLAVAVVVGQVDNPLLLNDLLGLLENPSPKVVYWGAKGLTQPNIRKYLLSIPATDKNLQAVSQGLNKAVDKLAAPPKAAAPAAKPATPAAPAPVAAAPAAAAPAPKAGQPNDAILAYLATAGALPQDPASSKLLQKIVAVRLEAYKNWVAVGNELFDLDIIRQCLGLVGKGVYAEQNSPGVRDLVKAAADLYTAAFFRYQKGLEFITADKKTVNLLSTWSQAHLPTVLIEGEKEFLKLSVNRIPPRMLPALKLAAGTRKAEMTRAFENVLGLAGPINQVYKVGVDSKNFAFPDPPAQMATRAQAMTNTLSLEPSR